MKKINKGYYYIWLSITFLVFMIFFYGYRFITSYMNSKKIVINDKSLKYKLTENIVYTGDGLHKQEELYYFYGNNLKNNVYFDGRMYQVISINDNNIKMIGEAETIIYYGNKGFSESYINKWLNDKYLTSIKNKDYLVANKYCIDEFDKEITCSKLEEMQVGLLSAKEYEMAGASKSYLNNNMFTWLLNTNTKKEPWYINEEGKLGIANNIASLSLRPVITISDKDVIKGTGTKKDPYIISQNNPNKLSNTIVGEYIKYQNKLWRIIGNNNNTKLILNDTLEKKMIFSPFDNNYDAKRNNSVAFYLVRDYLKEINSNKLVDNKFNVGIYEKDYSEINKKQLISKIGLPEIGDHFTISDKEIFTINPTGKATQAVYTVSKSGTLLVDDVKVERYIKPVITISNHHEIQSGDGTINNPYIMR